MKLSLGFSPCPNDTFIFDALLNGKIATGDITFDPLLEDIETLNRYGSSGKLDVVKLSLPAYFSCLKNYVALPSGGAMGIGVGPLLVSRNIENTDGIEQRTIAIPGHHTTANFLLSFAFPNSEKRVPMLFSEIEEAVISGKTDLGVLIHENRFTYHQRGLNKLLDLGSYWQEKTGKPVPLACIAIKRGIAKEVQLRIAELIKQSVAYAWNHYPQLPSFVTEHAQAMDEEVMRKHIELYVNEFTSDLGQSGKAAIENLYSIYRQHHKSDDPLHQPDLFLG